MAELQAIFLDSKNNAQVGWRKAFTEGSPIRLGRLPNLSDWWMNDEMISGVHATLLWDGSKLKIQLRDPAPVNPIWHNRQKVKGTLEIGLGESFIIGSTKFTLLNENDLPSEPLPDHTIRLESGFSSKELQFDSTSAFFKAIERLPSALSLSTDEEQLFRNMITMLLNALPWANTAAIVALIPELGDDDLKVSIRHHQQRAARAPGQLSPGAAASLDSFMPSRKLVNKAVRVRKKSTLHIWDENNARDAAMTVNPQLRSGKPWAICTPIGDETHLGLYVDGCVAEHLKLLVTSSEEQELGDYQKVIELIASLINAARVAIEKDHQLNLCRRFLPRRLWMEMDEKRINKLLEPRVVDTTVLFCDLRGSCKMAEEGEHNLQETWKHLSEMLDDITRAISLADGIVAGIQGDGVVGFWGWPEAGGDKQSIADNLERAAKVALQIRDRFHRGAYGPQFRCGIGIAHGKTMAGRLGTLDLAKVDVYGTVVNLASRLESLTKQLGVSIIIDEATSEGLNAIQPQRRGWRTRRLARIRPAGMNKHHLISELLPQENDPSNTVPENLRRSWERVINHFLDKEWSHARADLEYLPDTDLLANFLRDYMKQFNYTAPENWDGVIPLVTK